MTNSVRNIYLTKTINSAEFVYCKLWRNWLFSHVKFAAEWNVDYIGGGILTTFLRSFGITYRKKKRKKREPETWARVSSKRIGLCAWTCLENGGKKKKIISASLTQMFVFSKIFFLLLFLLESCRSLVFFLLRYYSDGGYHQMGGRQWLLPTSITVRHNRTCRRPVVIISGTLQRFHLDDDLFFLIFSFCPFF